MARHSWALGSPGTAPGGFPLRMVGTLGRGGLRIEPVAKGVTDGLGCGGHQGTGPTQGTRLGFRLMELISPIQDRLRCRLPRSAPGRVSEIASCSVILSQTQEHIFFTFIQSIVGHS